VRLGDPVDCSRQIFFQISLFWQEYTQKILSIPPKKYRQQTDGATIYTFITFHPFLPHHPQTVYCHPFHKGIRNVSMLWHNACQEQCCSIEYYPYHVTMPSNQYHEHCAPCFFLPPVANTINTPTAAAASHRHHQSPPPQRRQPRPCIICLCSLTIHLGGEEANNDNVW
jgi:hypothetical protein